MRRSILLASSLTTIALLACSSWLPTNRSAAGQGKGGEVIAKPTPTPTPKKPASNRAKTGSRSPRSGSSADELAFWESIKNSTDPEDFKAYLEQYPKGKFVTLAKNRLKTLEAAKGSTNPSPTNPTPTGPSSTNPSSSKMPRTRTNQAGIEFVLIPPGSFMMGSVNGAADERPVHQVTISQPFYIGKYEVTQAQWQSVMGKNPSNFKDCGGNCPVEQMSWDDAQSFINKLNEGHDGFWYRLPTEAEWEYACRAGTTGDDAGNLDDMAWYADNSGKRTHPVGQKQANAFGLYDMHGNVWEWCRDWYDANYYVSSPATDPQGPGSGHHRVLRGGSWSNNFYTSRSAIRGDSSPAVRDDYAGFRVVAVPRSDSNPTDSTVSNPAKPPNPLLPLHSFDFVTVTLDSSGKLKSRETKSANAYTEDLGGGVKLEMVAIPPGEFMMGSPETEVLRSKDEGPQHRVRIGYWLYMGKFAVTQAQWRAVMSTSPSFFKDCDECPVEQVSWDDSTEFCRKLSARTGRQYRLPSEAEWEYTARAGTMTPFAFGDTITPEIVNYNGEEPYGNAAKGANRQKTVPAGSLGVANALGLYDMLGNVSEWCQDWWHDSYSAIAGDAPTDGSAWVTGGDQKYQVLRGGSYFAYALQTRSAYRSASAPIRSPYYGFRVVAVR
jgi:formylglycine-generating enzyme required for sulfatase activity